MRSTRFLLTCCALSTLAAIGCTTSPPKHEAELGKVEQAVWNNGNFEADPIGTTPPTGWTVTTYWNDAGVTGSTTAPPSSFSQLNLTPGGKTETYVVGGTAETQSDPDLGAGQAFRFPRYGVRAARVNYKDSTDTGKAKSANSMKQTMTVAAGDIDPIDGKVHVRAVVAPVLENPAHGYKQQPFYWVELANLTRGTTMYRDFNTAGQNGVPWITSSSVLGSHNTVQWTNWQLIDVSPSDAALAIGDQVQLTVVGSGCSLGAHFGRVYVDGMGASVPGLYTWATGPQTSPAGSDITYTIYYANGAATQASGVKIDLVTPPNTTYQANTGTGCTAPAVNGTGTVSCPIGVLNPGSSGSFTVTVNINSGATVGSYITNGNYQISGVGSSALIGPKVKTSVIASGTSYADIGVTTTPSANAVNWGTTNFTYTIVVHNYGPNRARTNQLSVVDNFPAQLTNVTWTCTRTSPVNGNTNCNGASGTGNINTHPILNSADGEVTYVVTGDIIAGSGTSSMTNTVTATLTGRPDPDTSNNSAVTVTGLGTPRTLTFSKGGTGSGTVTSSPQGLSCGTACANQSPAFANGTVVTLTASPAPGSTFTSWTGGVCSGSVPTCTVTMSANRTVTANFAAQPAVGAATTVSVYAGNNQLARKSTAFGSSLQVIVTDANGRGVSGQTISWAATTVGGGTATLSGATSLTNANGIATITATANAVGPATYSVTATRVGLTPATFTLTNVGDPASLEYVSGGNATDPNETPVSTAFPAALMVRVLDGASNPVPGVTVNFASVPAGGATATLSAASNASNSSGYATVNATANATIGNYTVNATSTGLNTITFTMHNLAATPANVFVISGNPQHIDGVTLAFEQPLVVGVSDALGNPLNNVTVNWAKTTVGGATATLSNATTTTNASGITSITATSNGTPGTYSVTATVGALTPATFTLTNDGTRSIDVFGGSPQSTTIGTAFTTPITAIVTNVADGALVNGVVVTFTSPGSGASTTAVSTTATTNAQGRASITPTANTVAGSYTVSATTPTAGNVAGFALTNNPGAAASVSKTLGDSQHTTINTSFPVGLVVTVKDASNNVVPNATVTFAAPVAGASAVLTGSPATTDANGQAFVTAVANGTVGGPYNVSATVGALPLVNFALTNDECGVAGDCAAVANGTPTCVSNVCVPSCNAGFGNCNGTYGDGCEIDLNTDATKCGSCGNDCSFANAADSCVSGTCTMGACNAGFGDCVNGSADGCETNLNTDATHCGLCTTDCSFANAADSCNSGTCQMGACNAGFDDCNSSAADGCETNLNTDATKCGSCGNDCSFANAADSCVSGSCVMGSCNAGFDDCNSSALDGCETNLNTDATKCGSCGNDCAFANAADSCVSGSCVMGSCNAGFDDCNSSALDGCETNLNTDATKCGSCGNDCAFANAADSCVIGTCQMGACNAGFDDCNSSAVDGCEINLNTDATHCGTCGTDCSFANAADSCSGGECQMGACNAGFDDCNNSATDGCEINLNTDATHCGACGTDCSFANAADSCVSGECAMGACNPGFADCNSNPSDGCEVNLNTDATHCGACATDCAFANAADSCVSGECAMGACNAGFDDCNDSDTDGCEVNLNTDATHCGACATDCAFANAADSCVSGECTMGACDAGFDDCNSSASDGCEINLNTDATHCGACATDCAFANAADSCVSGECTMGACDAGFDDCNSSASDGCEINLNTDATHCGACATDCSFANAADSCNNGSCQMGACDTGFDDCNSSASDGCEINLNTDATHCGACATDCSFANAADSCNSGECQMGACDAGFDDCNENSSDGCEINLNTDATHCGACATDCAFANAADSCNSGECQMGACDAGFDDCNSSASDGCEINLNTDATHCGACATDCAFANAADSCNNGSCQMGACDTGFGDCNTDSSDGCEINLNTDATHCGACATDCAFTNAADSCVSGSCTMGACDTNFADCDESSGDGCEVNTQTDVHHCGGCDNDCAFGNAGASCTAGSCTIGPCNSGFGNCDSNDANGCETITNGDDEDHCGDCDTACTDVQYCASGTCTAKKANDVACAAADECTSGICDTDDKCGKPNGGSCAAAADCRGGACSVSSVCMDAGKCAVDGDCTSDEFCDTGTHECADKLDNDVAIPTIADHDPELTGACTDPVGAAVCVSGVCDGTDNKCGFANGDGDCDGSNADTVCRSGSCGSDDKCGFPNGEGACTAVNAGVVCRSGICGALSHVCAEAVGCAVDSDCTAAQFCDTSTGACTAKLDNGTAVPTIANHTPALTSVCTQAVGAAVCASGVCDAVDDKCGYDNGDGSCSEDTAESVCRSGVCGSDDKCGYPDGEGECTSVTAGAVCRTGVCSSASHVCVETSGCVIDGDCNSSQFCNTVTKLCTPKLDNGSVIPGIAGHDPELDGTCSKDVGAAVCSSGTCDMADDKCGMRNGAGPCTTANAGSVCRSGVCGADGMCGFPDGAGSCTSSNAAARCRSGQCDAESGKCGVAPGCSEDKDCEDSQYCDVGGGECKPKLDDGVDVPAVEGNEQAPTGTCTAQSGKSICKSGVCDERDNRCGFANEGGSCDETSAETVCRSGACGSDGKCGFNDAEGSCTDSNAQTVCRTGMCANGVCGPAPGCEKDSQCSSSQYCDLDKHECAKKKPDGKVCKSDNQCKSDSCSTVDKVCNTCIGDSCGKVKLSGGGCSVSSTDDSSPSQSLLLIALSAIALALRVRRRQRARV